MDNTAGDLKYGEKQEPKDTSQTTNSPDFVGRIATGIKDIFDADLYKSLTLISILGYIVIAFSGHVVSWNDVLRYLVVIISTIVSAYILYVVEVKMKISQDFIANDLKTLWIYLKGIYIPQIILSFVNIYIWFTYTIPLLINR